MAITREFDDTKGTVMLFYKGEPLTPELDLNDPKQILDVLSAVIEEAYRKIRAAGLD